MIRWGDDSPETKQPNIKDDHFLSLHDHNPDDELFCYSPGRLIGGFYTVPFADGKKIISQ